MTPVSGEKHILSATSRLLKVEPKPARKTVGNSSPLDLWIVIIATAPRSAEASDSIFTPSLIIPFTYATNCDRPRKADASKRRAYS